VHVSKEGFIIEIKEFPLIWNANSLKKAGGRF
jgi:hypothetical protein